MNSIDGYPVIDTDICNQCQKCIALCPGRALTMNGVLPDKASKVKQDWYGDFLNLLRTRRSTKTFQKNDIPEGIIRKIVESGAYAPNQNKNITVLAISDPLLIQNINEHALNFIQMLYNLFFSVKPLSALIGLFSNSWQVIKKKMERDLVYNKSIVKKNTNVLLFAVGNPRTPVTEASAQYILSTMSLTAHSLGIGSTLMDSLKMSVNMNRKLRRELGFLSSDRVLGVLALGYSAEKIMNIPQGYDIPFFMNKISRE